MNSKFIFDAIAALNDKHIVKICKYSSVLLFYFSVVGFFKIVIIAAAAATRNDNYYSVRKYRDSLLLSVAIHLHI